MFKFLTIAGLALVASSSMAARFTTTKCTLAVSPWELYEGRGNSTAAAKQDAVTNCEAETEHPEVCQAKLDAYEFSCVLNPGWDW